jgi:hypothetical protein
MCQFIFGDPLTYDMLTFEMMGLPTRPRLVVDIEVVTHSQAEMLDWQKHVENWGLEPLEGHVFCGERFPGCSLTSGHLQRNAFGASVRER